MAEIKDYQTIVGKENIDQLFRLARRLGKRKVIHVSSTRTGGGVAEMLNSLVPLMNELGIETKWEVITGDTGFFEVTKAFHNALQGNRVNISERMLENYLENNEKNASILDLEADIVIVHDPQPASLIRSGKGRAKWIWRCHIDVSRPERRVWKFLKGFVSKYDASIFSMSKFAHNLPHPQYIIFPSIDPLSQKNRELSQKETDEIKRDFGINNLKPTILQISRFDRFKDPLGVMEAYRLVKRNTDCKLILAGGGAADDPEGFEVLTQVKEQKKGDPDIHLLFLPPTANREINALQRDADIVLQKSLKEGFGLTVTEAMWKKKPVIGGAVGGIVEQIFNYQTGFLVHSVEGAAYRIRYLLHHSNMARKMAENAKEYVRRRFLVTRHLRDYLSLFIALDHPQDDYISI
ncbi:MAG: glycosyl transferase family 1 [candidate division Zixibacteria bacterium SM23_73_2]|nr:MAG: glycosyl transferase family 1 [candidate division Zixibacteria bacterium SM23_73_2]